MNVLEKAEKALEFLKANEATAKSHELQAAAATLGRCLGALGSRPSYARHYANLLHSAIPTLLFLASNNSAEVRLVGDEALNRAVVGGFAFHSHKTNILLQYQIDSTKNARWIRAALSRICLGDCWLRPGVGKIRSQAQTLFPRLGEIVAKTTEIQLIVEALEANLPRILTALAEYTTDEEIADLSKSLLNHVANTSPAVRRGIAACVAHLCGHRETALTALLGEAFDKLWPLSTEGAVVLGWFCVIKAIFQINDVNKFIDNDLFTVHNYLELYHLCILYLEQSSDHNVQNCVMECLTTLLSCAPTMYSKCLLDACPRPVNLDQRESGSTAAPVQRCRFEAGPPPEPREALELSFTGALQLGSLAQLHTPRLSCEDLTIQTPDSPESEGELDINTEQLTKELSEKLQEYEEAETKEDQVEQNVEMTEQNVVQDGYKINIGSSSDEDVPLKYCARLLASKFLLTGNKGGLISDRSVRVSVKSSALNCLSELLRHYPQAMTLYLDKDADCKTHNISGSTEATDSNQDNANEFILERNVCYQESLSDSISQDLLKSTESQTNSQQRQRLEKLEKSLESEQKSSNKDVQSAILDSKYCKNDLIQSAMSQDSTNMTNSNFTTNSNMTDEQTTGYPMTSSGDILSSSIDLDMKFDHFGESTYEPKESVKDTTTENATETVTVIKQKVEVKYENETEDVEMKSVEEKEKDEEFQCQHMADVFDLLEGHHDPQIRGLIRVCVSNYLVAAIELAHGDYNRWKGLESLPKDVVDCLCIERLVEIVLKGLSDEIHSTVNHTLSSLSSLAACVTSSVHSNVTIDVLNALVSVENNAYWLCKVNLCKLYEKLPYQKLFMLYPDYRRRSRKIMDTLIRLLADQDQKVRNAASQAITSIIPTIFPSRQATPTSILHQIAIEHTQHINFCPSTPSLHLVRELYFYNDLPEQMKGETDLRVDGNKNATLRMVLSDLVGKLIASSCKFYSQGLLETLQALTIKYAPWHHIEAYSDQGILSFCLDSLEYCNGTVACKTLMLDLCRMVYPVEIHNIMKSRTSNRDIFERDSQTTEKWQHLDGTSVASHAEKFLNVTLKMLNVLVHLIEEVNPNVHLNKSGIALPGSPVRRKTQDPIPLRKTSTPDSEDKSLRKKPPPPASSLKANFSGHFYNEPFFMRLYDSLRAVYSNHKINLDPKSSIFHTFLTTVLHCLAIQLELATEKEFGPVTEEILYYLKVIMPLRADLSVYCITQLLKCLFGTNMVCQYYDFSTISDKTPKKQMTSFFDDVMQVNEIKQDMEESRRSSICSSDSQRVYLEVNKSLASERQLLIAMENFAKNKTDRKWSTNKKELERYIRLFEPVVIQSLKSYTMQNDIPLQCQVLKLLNQLLTLRVNYCMLDSDQIFIGFLMKQLDLIEQHEIPNCCDLVNGILTFLVQLSSSRHHSKQIIEIPKLIQLCDGLMASGAHNECIAGLVPVAVKVFANMGGSSVLGRAQQQEAQATREVLFYMLQKTMHQEKVLNLVCCVLALSQEHSEGYYRWSELASDTILALLAARSVELETPGCAGALEKLVGCISSDALLDQPRVEMLIRILFQTPPEATSPFKLKLRYLSAIMVLLRKYLSLIPESEILLTIDYMKATGISPQSIFFNVKTDVDPLNVQNVNENCANLSPDVILVRFLFKTLTYALQEVDRCYEDAKLDCIVEGDKVESARLMYSVCVGIIVHVKHMLHLTSGCLFPLTSKTAQNLLHNEQSGLNTGLYSPVENIPLDSLNAICLKASRRAPCLTLHWSHLLIRLNFLTHKYWQKLLGFARNLPLSGDNGDNKLLTVDLLQLGCVMAYVEYFIDNGLSEAVHLTWLLVNRICILVLHWRETIVQRLIKMVQEQSGAAGLLLQAVAARCQSNLKEQFALNTYKILSLCHESQSGALVFFICRIISKLEPSVAVRFAKLATDRCKMLKEMPVEKINSQLSKEDVQVALELLQRDKVHTRYSTLVMELNSLASTVFDLSPLDLSQDRAVNPQYIHTTNVDGAWLLNQVKSRCCVSECTALKVAKHKELARLLANLSKEDLTAVMSCPEFDRRLIASSFKVACDNYLREFINIVSAYEDKEYEKDVLREQQMESKMKEEMTSSIDSNKLNVVNTLHVFKKSDNKESKSQFFIPISDNENLKQSFGNLQISDEETELVPPELPDLYKVSAVTFDKSLTDVIRLFPKQNRPLSQSENFSLNIEQTIDRYTRRCHQVFQDKLFYQEFMILQTIMTGFLESLDRIIGTLDEADCEILDKCMENILPTSLARNIATFSVISLQYLSFLIKNKSIVETPIHADVSFRVTVNVTDNVVIDNVIELTVDNVSKALSFDEIWSELNVDNNLNRSQSAISCLYAIVKYLVKDTHPLILHSYIPTHGPKSEMATIGDKLVTLLQYWEQNVYTERRVHDMRSVRELVRLTVSLARLDVVSSIALIPPIAWPSVDMSSKKDFQKVDLPLQALQDADVLQAFLFRANLISWSSKKQFEEMWVGLLGALQGNGPHWAVRGITQLLLTAAPSVKRRGILHVPRSMHSRPKTMQRLRNILVGTSSYSDIFSNINLERVSLMKDGGDGYHCAQLNTQYLRLAADISECGSYRIRRELKRVRRNKDLDLNSCLQILMDVTTQMLDPKAETGVAARVSLINLIGSLSATFSSASQCVWAGAVLDSLTGPAHAQLAQYSCAGRALLAALSQALAVTHSQKHSQELSSVHQKLIKALSSSYAPLRAAALQGCLLQLAGGPHAVSAGLMLSLHGALNTHLASTTRISLYEQCVYWAVLFTLVELGHPDLINLAVDFILKHPRHYCTDLVVKGITTTLRQHVLPKELKNSLIERLLDNMKGYSEHHAVQILMVHLFTADDKLLSPRLTCDVSNMDPDVLMNSMERITLLYKILKQTRLRESKEILTDALKYFLRETLPPAATLSRVVIEFVECCKEGEERLKWEGRVGSAVLHAELVNEVFETSITQDQLPVLSGWIFEALSHLLNGKISNSLTPYCVLTLLVSASSNPNIRKLAPLCYYILKLGFEKLPVNSGKDGKNIESVDFEEKSDSNVDKSKESDKRKSVDKSDKSADTTSTDIIRRSTENTGKSTENTGKSTQNTVLSNKRNCQDPWGIFKEVFHSSSSMSFHDRRLLCIVALKSNFTKSQLERLKQMCDSREGLEDLKQCLAV